MEKGLQEFHALLKSHVDAMNLPAGETISKMVERVKYFGASIVRLVMTSEVLYLICHVILFSALHRKLNIPMPTEQ